MKTALIFAAGRGERLRPLTNHICKAMCLVKGIPLIEYHIRRLAEARFTKIVINHAYLGGQIRRHLQDGSRFGIKIVYSPEPPGALETGGAICQALPLLGKEPFVTLSADIFTDFPFERLALSDTYDAHLVLTSLPHYLSKADFSLASHLVTTTSPHYTFGNIACFHPRVFQQKPLRRIPLGPWLHALVKEKRVTGEVYEGQWINIGNAEQLKEAQLK